jgi:energy-coupling factor transport system ATP-binding protein
LLPEEEVAIRVKEAASVVGLADEYFESHPFFLSKGLRQRVAIASIMALRPKVIIVDEPTTGQDARQSYEIMDFLTMLNREHGHTIIIITHDMPIVAHYARRVIAMADGKILADGETAEIFKQASVLEKASLEPPQITQFAQRLQNYGFNPGTLTVEQAVAQFQQIREKVIPSE